MNNRITLKKIAAEFNVTIATVSKALNDSHEISVKTKEKIQAFAKKHNYKPNKIALSLLNKKTKTLGVIIPNIMNSFFTEVFVGIEEKATELGYNLISCISNESFDKEVNTVELLKNGTIDGFLVSLAEETQINKNFNHFKEAINEGVPLVLFDRVTDEIKCDKVIVNDFEGARHATEHLIKTGCKKIALVSVIDNLSVGKLRVEGYKQALLDHEMPINEKIIVRLNKKEDLETSMKIVLSDKAIDGLLCLEESSAIQSLELIKSMNYKIPEEMSIICFTNGKLPQHVTPTITTISQHGKYIGEIATKMLVDRLESKSELEFTTKVIKTSLIERGTTIPLK
ncbi:LacI family DNA-binding transcriptional regulator [Flavobacterium gilvum]|uniref:LacI family transcriptional regulator n=1 Tax=Flavobacterium gilvum TaxID=1492737 RepID=A0AAC9N5L3_9FLAO|nr:LacI family DNA-binding transcriptional regulator [Flavobacterium gilvum]AOW09926.1 LacI family transcriptional regulator [Flavobacterium gilvum]KFC59617.1 LacI family transcriptional regulator [Flavobacterium gilvum]